MVDESSGLNSVQNVNRGVSERVGDVNMCVCVCVTDFYETRLTQTYHTVQIDMGVYIYFQKILTRNTVFNLELDA